MVAKASGRGSKPGEHRGGRKKGTPNKSTMAVKEIAGEYGPEAIAALAEIMRSPEHPAAARVSAANGLLDRAYGRPMQALDVSAELRGKIEVITGVPRAGD